MVGVLGQDGEILLVLEVKTLICVIKRIRDIIQFVDVVGPVLADDLFVGLVLEEHLTDFLVRMEISQVAFHFLLLFHLRRLDVFKVDFVNVDVK